MHDERRSVMALARTGERDVSAETPRPTGEKKD